MAGGLFAWISDVDPQRLLLFILISISLGGSPLAHGAIERSVVWSGVSGEDLKDLSLRNYTSRGHLRSSPDDEHFSEQLTRILNNEDGRISASFSIPATLKSQVAFWLKVFTQWHSGQAIFVDEYHLDWVYAVADLAHTSSSRARTQVERAVLRLGREHNALHLSKLERQIWTVWGQPHLPVKTVHGHSVRNLAKQVHLQRGARDALIRALALSEPYLPKMEAIFEEQRLPTELTRLSLLESAFQWDALSKVGARGLWQFMNRTAQEYLLLSPEAAIDERLSPWKSTVAASLLLRGNRARLGNWFLAITAYNHGFRGLSRSLDTDRTLSELVQSACRGRSPLGWASRNYYAEFLAVLYAEAFHAELFGDKPEQDLRPVRFWAIPRSATPRDLALNLGLPLSEFLKLNPDLEATHTRLPKGFFIAVPAATDDFRALITRYEAPRLTASRTLPRKGRLQ